MPPGQTIPGNLSFAVAREILKTDDMERLACAFLNATDNVNVSLLLPRAPWSFCCSLCLQFNAEKAAREFGNVKPESFKRAIWVITKKLKEHGANGGGDDDDDGETPAVAKPKGGRKRKTDGEGGEAAAPKKKGKGGKKARAETEDGESPLSFWKSLTFVADVCVDANDAVVVKAERKGDEDSDGDLV